MKKIILLSIFLGLGIAWAAEPLLLINPFRETILSFPSEEYKDGRTVTVFLPEQAVPLHGRYPTVYLLGASPQDASAARAVQERSNRKVLLVGVDLSEQDLADWQRVRRFLLRDLIPYIEVNYAVQDNAQARAVAATGSAGAAVVSALLQERTDTISRAVLAQPGIQAELLPPAVRVILAGTQPELATWQQLLQERGGQFGVDFVTRLQDKSDIFDALEPDYLFASKNDVQVFALGGVLSKKSLSLQSTQQAKLQIWAVLKNGLAFDFIPLALRLSPPYIQWNAASGELAVINGAQPGTVKVTAETGSQRYQTKIQLKK